MVTAKKATTGSAAVVLCRTRWNMSAPSLKTARVGVVYTTTPVVHSLTFKPLNRACASGVPHPVRHSTCSIGSESPEVAGDHALSCLGSENFPDGAAVHRRLQ